MNATNPLVSIIIPNYNGAKFIAPTIESVINQTYTNWELLIVDDHSKDNSEEVISKYLDNNIELHKTPNNSGGPATPRNIGITKAKGEYIAFLDSDDIWHPEKLEAQIKFALQNKVSFVSSYKENFQDQEPPFETINFDQLESKKRDYSKLLKKNLINTSTVLINKNFLGDLRFDEASELIAVEDYDLWLRVLKKSKKEMEIIKFPLIYYRITDINISKSKVKQAKKVIRVLKKNVDSLWMIPIYFLNYCFRSIFYLKNDR